MGLTHRSIWTLTCDVCEATRDDPDGYPEVFDTAEDAETAVIEWEWQWRHVGREPVLWCPDCLNDPINACEITHDWLTCPDCRALPGPARCPASHAWLPWPACPGTACTGVHTRYCGRQACPATQHTTCTTTTAAA